MLHGDCRGRTENPGASDAICDAATAKSILMNGFRFRW
jgi:hypothetical protein